MSVVVWAHSRHREPCSLCRRAWVGLHWPSLGAVGLRGPALAFGGSRWLLWAFVDLGWRVLAFVGLRWPLLSPGDGAGLLVKLLVSIYLNTKIPGTRDAVASRVPFAPEVVVVVFGRVVVVLL